MKNYLYTILVSILSLMFMACPPDDRGHIMAPHELKIRVENNGPDLIETVTIQTSDQTITLNQLAVDEITGYYIISNESINNNISISFQNAEPTSVTTGVSIGYYGNYTLKVSASNDLSTTLIDVVQD